MNHWQQTKTYQCPKCGATYLHDRAYPHDCFRCPARQMAGMGAQPRSRENSPRIDSSCANLGAHVRMRVPNPPEWPCGGPHRIVGQDLEGNPYV